MGKPLDPLNLAKYIPAETLRKYETVHCRVAMLACVGYAFPRELLHITTGRVGWGFWREEDCRPAAPASRPDGPSPRFCRRSRWDNNNPSAAYVAR